MWQDCAQTVSYTHLDVYKRQDIILKYNEKALEKEKHPRDVYKEPSALIVICANATMASVSYTHLPAPALAHAIYRATGVWHRTVPFTPEKILMGMVDPRCV